jgi:hypothetical protein
LAEKFQVKTFLAETFFSGAMALSSQPIVIAC